MVGVECMAKSEAVSERRRSQEKRVAVECDDRPYPRGDVGGEQQRVDADHLPPEIIFLIIEQAGQSETHIKCPLLLCADVA